MQVTLENTGRLERKLHVAIPEDRIEDEVSTRLKSMTRTAKIPGFRPGKVPLKIVAQRYGRKVREEVVGEVVRSSFYDALVKENLRPAGSPTIEPVASEPGKGVSYTAVFEVFPEIPPPEVEGLQIVRPVAEVAEADVDKMIETLRRQRQTWEAVERAATDGDRVVIDFVGTVEGEEFEGNKGTEVPVVLGAGRMLEGFESGLTGASAGESRTVEVQFPDDYRVETLAGKTAAFAVEVRRVEEPLLPDVDDEFARQLGVAEGGVEALRREVRKNLERELADAIRSTVKQGVMDALIAKNPVDPPHALVEEEKHRMFRLRIGELAQQGVDAANLGLRPDMFEEQARRRIALGLLLAEVVRANELSADQEKVRARIDTIASTYEDPQQVVSWYYADKARLAEVESTVLEDQVVDWVLERAEVTEETRSFDDLLNPGQTTEKGAEDDSTEA